jgi:hypothetical protein
LNNIAISYYTACSTSTKTVAGTTDLENFSPGTIATSSITIDSSPKVVGEEDAVLTVTFTPGTVLKING